MDISRYLDASKRVDLTGIDFESAADFPLHPDEIRCLTYMTDIESHTIVYLRGLLNTCAIDDPEVTAFLSCWAYEEFFHSQALRQFLEACGVPAPAALATVEPAKPAVDEKKLEAMAKAAEPAPPVGKPSPATEKESADLSKADEKLSSLLGKPKQ